VVGGGADQLYAPVMRLAVRTRARKRRQKAVMNVYDRLLPFAEEIAGQHLHVAREHHGVGLQFKQTSKQPSLGLRLAVLADPNHVERNTEGARKRLKIGMVADDADHLGLKLTEPAAAQQVHHAMRQARYHDDHPVTPGSIMEVPPQLLPREQAGEAVSQIPRQLGKREPDTFEIDTPEEMPVCVISMLVRGDDIAPEIEQAPGHPGDNTGAIDARNQKNCPG